MRDPEYRGDVLFLNFAAYKFIPEGWVIWEIICRYLKEI